MAVEAEVRHPIRHAVCILREYAETQGWTAEDYHVYVRPNLDWWYIDLLLVARRFPKEDEFDNFVAISDFIDAKWKKDDARPKIGLSLLTFDQVAQGGAYAIPSTYLDGDDFCPPPS